MTLSPARAARLAERNAAIVAARHAGETLAAIGARYGVSRERVRQIYYRQAALLAERASFEEALTLFPWVDAVALRRLVEARAWLWEQRPT